MKLKLKILLILMTLSLISCGSIPSQAKLRLPPPIDYPKVSSAEVSCLKKSVKDEIKLRDKLKSARIETLRNIIKSTH